MMFKKMKDYPYGPVDERTKAVVYQGDAYAGRFLMFAILLDVAFREITGIKTYWDSFILVMAAGCISIFYQIKHKILFNDSNYKQGLFIAVFIIAVSVITALITALLL